MTRDQIIEQVARKVWREVVKDVGVAGAARWEELPRWHRMGFLADAARVLDAAGYFELREAVEEAKREIEYWHDEYLTEDERNHPRGSGWARVHDKLAKALGGDAE